MWGVWKRFVVAAILLAASLTGCTSEDIDEDRREPADFISEATKSGESSVDKKSFDAGEFDSIQLSAEAMDIYVTKSAGQAAYVELITTEAIRKRMTFESSIDARVLKLQVNEEIRATVFPDKEMAGKRKLLISLPDKSYGTVKIRNNIGNIVAENLQADAVEIELDAGDIRLNRISGQMRLASEAGDIIVEGVRLNRDLSARTKAGDVYVHFAESPQDANINLGTQLGSVTSDLEDVSYTQNSDNRKIGTIRKGGHTLDVSTEVGNITIDAPAR
jgi:DUF4097 and DUF4098 domain-containing protein YvlB